MVDTYYEGERWRLRAGTSMPVGDAGAGDFVIHTFKSESNRVDNYTYTDNLPASTDFRGQFGANDYMSASFNRQSDISGNVFAGEIVHKTNYQDEDTVRSSRTLNTTSFMECTSLSLSYDIMGRATVSYTIISDTSALQAIHPLTVGGQTFTGYISSVNVKKIPKTSKYEIQVSLVTTTD